MNQRQIAAILIVSATILAIGSYVLIKGKDEQGPVHRAEVKQPEIETPKAPAWVNLGQDAKPDYRSSAKTAQNATPLPDKSIKQKKDKAIEFTEDEIVTFTFIESLSDFILYRFQPQTDKGIPATQLSAKALNMYYGRELDGFSVSGDDIRMSRKKVLNYAFTPVMIKQLYELYAPVLMAHLINTASTDERDYKVINNVERRTLTNEEIKMMLRLNARKLEQAANVFRAIANDPSITELTGKHLRSAKAVQRANIQLQNAISDEKDTSTPSQRLKQAIQQRERVKTNIISHLKKACQICNENELFYLAQWSYRRVLNNPKEKLEAFGATADILNDLTERFRAQADKL